MNDRYYMHDDHTMYIHRNDRTVDVMVKTEHAVYTLTARGVAKHEMEEES